MATKKTTVELSDSKLLSLMKSSLFTAEFPFLKAAYDAAQQTVQQAIPGDCSPCKRKRLMKEAARGRKVNFDNLRKTIRGLPVDRLRRMKELLRASEVRLSYMDGARKQPFKF